jgi:hypothetical protein
VEQDLADLPTLWHAAVAGRHEAERATHHTRAATATRLDPEHRPSTSQHARRAGGPSPPARHRRGTGQSGSIAARWCTILNDVLGRRSRVSVGEPRGHT